jgi:hypothetical protein
MKQLRRIALARAAAGTLAVGGVVAAAPAQASSAAPAAPCEHPCHSPGPGWSYITDYYWASTCNDTGNQGINAGRWHAYQCTGGGAFENYELWVR